MLDSLAVNYNAIYFEINFIIQLSALVFLLTLKQKFAYTRIYTLYFSACTTHSAGWFLFNAFPDEKYAHVLYYIRTAYIFSPYLLVMFLYYFPRNVHVLESKIYAWIGGLTVSGIFLVIYIRSLFQIPVFDFASEVFTLTPGLITQLYSMSMNFNIVWAMVLVLRKAKVLEIREAKGIRNYLYILIIMIFVGITYFFVVSQVLDYRLFTLVMAISINFVALMEIIFLLNLYPGFVTFYVRLTAFLMVGIFTLFSMLFRSAFSHHEQEQIESYRLFVQNEVINFTTGQSKTPGLEFIAEMPSNGAGNWQIIYKKNQTISIPVKVNPSDRSDFFVMTSDPAKASEYYKTVEFSQGNVTYRAGMGLIPFRKKYNNEFLLSIMLFIFFVTPVLLAATPLLLRPVITRPLNQLLSGFRTVDRGDYNAKLDVLYDDEIGYITKTFNKMMEAIRNTLQDKESAQKDALQNKELAITSLEKAHQIKEEGRRKIYQDLHDHIGARLTDVSLLSARLRNEDLEQISPRIAHAANEAMEILREQLQNINDMARLAEDFPGALRIILIRRYEAQDRTLRFSSDNEVRTVLEAGDKEDLRDELYAVITEIATNDLKYGSGTSLWNLQAKNGKLQLDFISNTMYDPDKQQAGRGALNLKNRASAVGGSLEVNIHDGKIEIRLEAPV